MKSLLTFAVYSIQTRMITSIKPQLNKSDRKTNIDKQGITAQKQNIISKFEYKFKVDTRKIISIY